ATLKPTRIRVRRNNPGRQTERIVREMSAAGQAGRRQHVSSVLQETFCRREQINPRPASLVFTCDVRPSKLCHRAQSNYDDFKFSLAVAAAVARCRISR